MQVRVIEGQLWVNITNLVQKALDVGAKEPRKKRRFIQHPVDTDQVSVLLEQFYAANPPSVSWFERDRPFRAWWGGDGYCFTLQSFREWWKSQVREWWMSPAQLADAFEKLGMKAHRVRFQGKGNALRVWECPFL